jgi:hypothetical protein
MYLEGSWFLFAFIFTAVISLVYDRITHNKAPKDAPYLPLPRSWLTGMPASYGEYIEHGYQTVRRTRYRESTGEPMKGFY